MKRSIAAPATARAHNGPTDIDPAACAHGDLVSH